MNTVLWNTIQLLFPQEVEARKAAGAINSREARSQCLSPETAFYNNLRNGSTQAANGASSTRGVMSSRRSGDEDAALARRLQREIDGQRQQGPTRLQGGNSRNQMPPSSLATRVRSRRGIPATQDEDAALALRLQREEFMQAFRGTQEQSNRSSSLTSARANLRAMASRAMSLRIRDRRV